MNVGRTNYVQSIWFLRNMISWISQVPDSPFVLSGNNNKSNFHTTNMYSISNIKGNLISPVGLFNENIADNYPCFDKSQKKKLCWVPWYSPGNFWMGVQHFSEANVSPIIKHSKLSKDYHLMPFGKLVRFRRTCHLKISKQGWGVYIHEPILCLGDTSSISACLETVWFEPIISHTTILVGSCFVFC